MIANFFTEKSKFSNCVLDLVVNSGGEKTFMDAVLQLCDEYEIDPSAVAGLLSDAIKAKIKTEAESLNFFKKTARLEI